MLIFCLWSPPEWGASEKCDIDKIIVFQFNVLIFWKTRSHNLFYNIEFANKTGANQNFAFLSPFVCQYPVGHVYECLISPLRPVRYSLFDNSLFTLKSTIKLNINPNINTTMDSDSDDYCDIAEEVIEDDIVETHQEPVNNNNGHRGADIEWLEMARFENSEMYKNSEYFKDTKDFFSKLCLIEC